MAHHTMCARRSNSRVACLSAHKDERVIAAIESAGAIAVYLPPYSPDFNGIEAMWSKVKVIVRSIRARAAEALLDAIGVAL